MRLFLFFLIATLTSQMSYANCRHALALGLDVSNSIDGKEYRLQLNGLANALAHPDVLELLLNGSDRPVHILIYEWSALNQQAVIAPWTPIRSGKDLAFVLNNLRNQPRTLPRRETAIGDALLFAEAQFVNVQHCDRLTLDLSSDGVNNDGPPPKSVTSQRPFFRDITVNALVVQPADAKSAAAQRLIDYERAKIAAYFKQEVIHGPGAFSIIATGFEDYERAMIEKLIKELSPLSVTQRHRVFDMPSSSDNTKM